MSASSDLSQEMAAEKTFYSPQDLSFLDPRKIPKHIAIIMDGNRRWAKQKEAPAIMGHWEGAEVLIEIVKAAAELGVQTLTVFAFSTENWIRPEEEVEALMHLFELYLLQKREAMVRDGIRLNAIGDISRLPKRVQDAIFDTKKATEHCQKINLVLALNYGSRDEIRRAFVQLLKQQDLKTFQPEEITEAMISQCLDTTPWGDPDLLIRTSGEFRVSNFLLWQISYAEVYITEVLWPEFTPHHLLQAVLAYQKRNRRLGGNL